MEGGIQSAPHPAPSCQVHELCAAVQGIGCSPQHSVGFLAQKIQPSLYKSTLEFYSELLLYHVEEEAHARSPDSLGCTMGVWWQKSSACGGFRALSSALICKKTHGVSSWSS